MSVFVPMAPVEMEALKKLLDYNRCDEETHFEEWVELNPDDKVVLEQTHIYGSIKILDSFVERWDDKSATSG